MLFSHALSVLNFKCPQDKIKFLYPYDFLYTYIAIYLMKLVLNFYKHN